jgi:hypothetical protein
MEAIFSSETSVATQQTTRRHIPEDDTLQVDFIFPEKLTHCSVYVCAIPNCVISVYFLCVEEW